jgi:hypothetical protein
MNFNYLLAPVFAVAMSLTGAAALAGAVDYAFEPVAAELKKGDDVTVAVRLLHKPTGKPVADAVIVRPRRHGARRHGGYGVAGRAAARRRARRLRLQDRSADGGTVPAERSRQGARRTGDRRRQGHIQSR